MEHSFDLKPANLAPVTVWKITLPAPTVILFSFQIQVPRAQTLTVVTRRGPNGLRAVRHAALDSSHVRGLAPIPNPQAMGCHVPLDLVNQRKPLDATTGYVTVRPDCLYWVNSLEGNLRCYSRLQNSPYFSLCLLSWNRIIKDLGRARKLWEGLALCGFPWFVRHIFPRHVSVSQGQNNR